MSKKNDDRETSLFLRELTEGTKEELKSLIPKIDLSPEISDEKVKQAILEISPDGMQKLFVKYGQQTVMAFIGEFTKGKQW